MNILGGLLVPVLLVLWWLVMGDTLMGWVRAPFRWINALAKHHATVLRSRKLNPDD